MSGGRHFAARPVDVLAICETRMIIRERSAKTMRTDLGKNGIGVHKNPARTKLNFGDPVDVAKIQKEIALPEGRPQFPAVHAVTSPILCDIAPPLVQIVQAKNIKQVCDAIGRVMSPAVAKRVVAKIRHTVVLNVSHVVAQPLQSNQVLKVVQNLAADWVADQVSGAYDLHG